MSHTPELWKIGNRGMIYSDDLQVAIMEPCKDASIEEQAANAARIVACVNGCAGLNPAAYREVVEALREFSTLFEQGYFENALTMPSGKRIVLGVKDKVKQALAHAEGAR